MNKMNSDEEKTFVRNSRDTVSGRIFKAEPNNYGKSTYGLIRISEIRPDRASGFHGLREFADRKILGIIWGVKS